MVKLKNINMNSRKKYKLHKIMAGATAVFITASFLSGCVINKSYKKNNNGIYMNGNSNYYYESNQSELLDEESKTSNNTSPTTLEEYSLIYNIDLKTIFNKFVNLTENDINYINNNISKINVNYPYSDLYFVSDNVEKYNNIKKYVSKKQNIFNNNSITGGTICSIVIANNLKENYTGESKISDQNIKKICDKMAETLNYILSNRNDVDLNLLSEKIQNLKIRNFSGFSNGSYDSETGVMWLDVSKLGSDLELLKKVVSHETVHLIQSNSLDELNATNYSQRLGPSYRFNDSLVNSLNWTWFAEGAAETIMMSETNSKEALTYPNLIKIIDAIKLSTIINADNGVNDFEYLSLNPDLNKLFEYFDCHTKQEKIEIINMMFSYEFLSGLSGSKSASEFYDNYENIYNEMDFSQKELFKKHVKGSIAQTLSKQFYKNLSNNIKNKEVSIKDVFELISIYESQMNKLTWYATTGYANDLREFITNYIDIQDNFFKVLAQKTNLTENEIKLAYEIYNLSYEYDVNDINVISGDQKNFINDIKNKRKEDKTVTIRYFHTEEISKTK